ncbi:hypothetical protein JXR01_00405 [Candidatus Kaiserbacteria bacterium]|nr:MAG: hypothetical protein JXR01_00405 [Candidatus Kaiserbacteria bacterium]
MENTEKELTINQVLVEIAGIEQQILMGPADSESDQLQAIRSALTSGEITPREALLKARRIEQERSSHYR